jgi:ABC-type multidrug transport system ATPase subunit
MENSNPLAKIENVTFRYPKSDADALSGVSLEIPRGSFFALLGPNGAGKTTLLRLLCGRFAKFSGSIELADDVRGSNVHLGPGSQSSFLDPLACGILLENPGIYPKLSVSEYVDYFMDFYAARIPTWNVAQARERIERIAKSLELPPLDTRMGKLSLGNRQKVQLLRAMAPAPKLLILDEPVANLDPMSREAVWKLIADWRKQEGGTAIVCSHILAEMEEEATDFAIIDRGHVLTSGRVADLAGESASFKVEVRSSSSKDNAPAGGSAPENPTAENIRAALSAAGIDASVNRSGTGLASLYKKTVVG